MSAADPPLRIDKLWPHKLPPVAMEGIGEATLGAGKQEDPVHAQVAEPGPDSSAHLAACTGALLVACAEARPADLTGAAALSHPDSAYLEQTPIK